MHLAHVLFSSELPRSVARAVPSIELSALVHGGAVHPVWHCNFLFTSQPIERGRFSLWLVKQIAGRDSAKYAHCNWKWIFERNKSLRSLVKSSQSIHSLFCFE